MTPMMPDGTPAPTVMTRDDLVRFLRIDGKDDYQAVENLRKKHGLPGIAVGRRVHFYTRDVVKWLEQEDRQR